MADLRSLQSIFDLNETDRKQQSTLALIVDVTAAHKKDVKKDYILRMKVMDESRPTDFCSVFIYSSELERLRCSIEFGDVLLLRGFSFDVWNGTFQAKSNKKSSWYVFSGNPQSTDFELRNETDEASTNRDFSNYYDRINQLRKFSEKHFKSNPVPLVTRNSNKSSDFDMILRVTESQPVNGSYKLTLTDSVNVYELVHRQHVEKGVYKVRSIAHITWDGQRAILSGNDYTNFLLVPHWMKSYKEKEWEKEKPKKARKASQGNKQGRLVTKLNVDIAPKLTTLRELSLKESPEPVTRVRCQILDMAPNSFEKCLKKFDAENLTEKDYESTEGKFIYNIELLATDGSMQGDIFSIFLYTFDDRGKEFLPGMQPEGIFGRNTLHFRQLFDNVRNRLLEETDNHNGIELLLSPLSSKTETIYRIVDTELVA